MTQDNHNIVIDMYCIGKVYLPCSPNEQPPVLLVVNRSGSVLIGGLTRLMLHVDVTCKVLRRLYRNSIKVTKAVHVLRLGFANVFALLKDSPRIATCGYNVYSVCFTSVYWFPMALKSAVLNTNFCWVSMVEVRTSKYRYSQVNAVCCVQCRIQIPHWVTNTCSAMLFQLRNQHLQADDI